MPVKRSDLKKGQVVWYFVVNDNSVHEGLVDTVYSTLAAITNLTDNQVHVVPFNMVIAIVCEPGEVLINDTKCECGANHTSNPRFHSRWCPRF